MSATDNLIIKGIPGGAQQSGVGTTPVAIDLRALGGRLVKIWCDEQDLFFCFAENASDAANLVVSGTQAASTTALVADRVEQGTAILRQITRKHPWLIVRISTTLQGPGTVRIKPVSAADMG